jgi:hypothetical protein
MDNFGRRLNGRDNGTPPYLFFILLSLAERRKVE